MPITVRCSCGKTYRVSGKLAGKKIRCKSCADVLVIRRPVAKTKPKAKRGDEDAGFLDVDLDAEFARMTFVQRESSPPEVPQSQFAHPTERFGLKEAGLDKPDENQAQIFIPSMPLVEKAVSKLLPLLGVALGLSLIGATFLLSAHYGIFWPFLGALGIIVAIASLNWLTRGDEHE